MRSTALTASHYAAHWASDAVRTTSQVTALEKELADLPEGEAKESKMLEILQCFHGYILKYVSMILHGHLPIQHHGAHVGAVNADTHLLLRHFIPADKASNRATLGAACITLHLAFKNMNTDEIYDALMLCMVKAVRRYDPYYSDKARGVSMLLIEGALSDKKKFTVAHVSHNLGYECNSYVRLLARRLFLLSFGSGADTIYERSPTWPPPKAFFQSGAVGLSYVASKWFRYYLVDHINQRMSEIEAKKGIFQLHSPGSAIDARYQDEFHNSNDRGIPHSGGDFTNPRTGMSVAVDLTLIKTSTDVRRMTLQWVNESQLGLLSELTKRDRQLLYCVYTRSDRARPPFIVFLFTRPMDSSPSLHKVFPALFENN
jgi:hypothetical protein